jgi:Uma2 family endonuclease
MTMPVATQTQIPPRPRPSSGRALYRLTVRQYLKMVDAGIFRDKDHVELLGGLLVDKMGKNPPHNVAVGNLAASLSGTLPAGWFVREEKSVQLGRWSYPEPDDAVIRGQRNDYTQQDPTAKDIGIIAEVSDTSYTKDRGSKWRKYAAAKIPVYWIVNLPQRQIEVYSAPSGKGNAAGYRDSKVYGQDDEVLVILDGRELGRIKVSDVLPVIVKS